MIQEELLGTPGKLRVLMVGAGASGLNVARQMESHMKNYELQIYEKNEDIGGTWFENRSVLDIISFLSDKRRRLISRNTVTPDVLVTFPRTAISTLGNRIRNGQLCKMT